MIDFLCIYLFASALSRIVTLSSTIIVNFLTSLKDKILKVDKDF